MKRLSFFLMSVLFAVSSFAQESGCHFEFEGIPVSGTLDAFLSVSEERGYHLMERTDHTLLLSGRYKGKKCRVLVESLPHEDCVWGLTVLLPSRSNWKGLIADYNRMCDCFQDQFGIPQYQVEHFNVSKPLASDSLKYFAVQQGVCMYKSVFENALGQIDVVIWSDDVNGCYVLVSYIDKFNSYKQQ